MTAMRHRAPSCNCRVVATIVARMTTPSINLRAVVPGNTASVPMVIDGRRMRHMVWPMWLFEPAYSVDTRSLAHAGIRLTMVAANCKMRWDAAECNRCVAVASQVVSGGTPPITEVAGITAHPSAVHSNAAVDVPQSPWLP